VLCTLFFVGGANSTMEPAIKVQRTKYKVQRAKTPENKC
jgi:hypothetical protein